MHSITRLNSGIFIKSRAGGNIFSSGVKKNLISLYIIFALVTAGFVGLMVFEGIIDEGGVEAASILYVGGTGPGNYSSIKDAVWDASPDDIVFVYNGTYYEYFEILERIKLVGNSNPYPKIIIPNNNRIWINYSNVEFRNFEIIVNEFNISDSYYRSAILVRNSNIIVENVIIHGKNNYTSQYEGIFTSQFANYAKVLNCSIYNLEGAGIRLTPDHRNIVRDCNIQNCLAGIIISNFQKDKSLDKIIFGNYLFNNHIGIYISDGEDNRIYYNTIKNNTKGLIIHSSNNSIYLNNIINNLEQLTDTGDNRYWNLIKKEGNYWSDYEGIDDGSNNKIEGDGIGDTNIPHNNVDNFPLINFIKYNKINDSDDDGLPDSWEEKYDLDPYDSKDADIDSDNDGLINIEEFQNRINPKKQDSDGDGLLDGQEIGKYQTDPNKLDTDEDGYDDGFEIEKETDPLDGHDFPKKEKKTEIPEVQIYLIISFIVIIIIVCLGLIFHKKLKKKAN